MDSTAGASPTATASAVLDDIAYVATRIADSLVLLVTRGERLSQLERQTRTLVQFTDDLIKEDDRKNYRLRHTCFVVVCSVLLTTTMAVTMFMWYRTWAFSS